MLFNYLEGIKKVGNESRDKFTCGIGQDTILDFNNQLDTKSNDCEVI